METPSPGPGVREGDPFRPRPLVPMPGPRSPGSAGSAPPRRRPPRCGSPRPTAPAMTKSTVLRAFAARALAGEDVTYFGCGWTARRTSSATTWRGARLHRRPPPDRRRRPGHIVCAGAEVSMRDLAGAHRPARGNIRGRPLAGSTRRRAAARATTGRWARGATRVGAVGHPRQRSGGRHGSRCARVARCRLLWCRSVHGNLPALEACLAAIEPSRGVHPDPVPGRHLRLPPGLGPGRASYLLRSSGARMLLGKPLGGAPPTPAGSPESETVYQVEPRRAELGADTRAALEQLVPFLEIELGGHEFLGVHGTSGGPVAGVRLPGRRPRVDEGPPLRSRRDGKHAPRVHARVGPRPADQRRIRGAPS